MIKHQPVMFEKALNIAVEKIRSAGARFCSEIVLVRDLRGRIRVLLPGSKNFSSEKKAELLKLTRDLSESLDKYGFPQDRTVLYADDLAKGDKIFDSEDRRLIAEEENLKIWLLDRQIMGQDWLRPSLKRETNNPRVTFFGIKGGVGRSTALTVWAWQLARKGKKILIIDLDLESPGVSSTLLPSDYLPEYGIVDWFVEDGVEQPETVQEKMIAFSPLAKDLSGDIQVLPAFGSDTGDYMSKLARCFGTSGGPASASWAERLQRMVELMERRVEPDLVVMDSRAGLHDIAAVTVTRMEADTFLFAVDSMQTWNAYSFLLRHWEHHPQVMEFRQKLQIVAGMVPETGRDKYLERFLENSWDLFRENLYDETDGKDSEDSEVFSFDKDSLEAPHYPLQIFWNRALQEFEPLQDDNDIDKQVAKAAMGEFMTEAETLVFGRK